MKLAALAALALTLGAGSASAREIEGVDYPETLNIAGDELKLVGVGLRTKWFFNVYTMGAYSKSGKKSARALIAADEPRFVWIRLLRGIGAEKMHEAVDEGLEKNTSEAERAALAERVAAFKSYLPAKLKKGLDIGFSYRPGTGTVITVGRAQKGTIPGADFAKGLFSVWFGKKPADKSLKRSILKND